MRITNGEIFSYETLKINIFHILLPLQLASVGVILYQCSIHRWKITFSLWNFCGYFS